MRFQRHWRARVRFSVLLTCCLLGGSVAAPGCTSGGGSSGAGKSRPSQAEIDAFHENFCASALRCCNAEGDWRIEECKLNLRDRGSGYDPLAGAACLAELARAEENGQCWAIGFGPSDPCSNIWNAHYGTSGPGDPCTDDADCVAPEEGMSICTLRSCVWLLPGAPGDTPCQADVVTRLDFTLFYNYGAAESVYCSDADGVHCDEESRTCQALSPEGGPCSASKACMSGDCGGGVCQAPVPSGETCRGGRTCVDSAYCDDDYVCDGDGVCAEPPFVCTPKHEPGSPCRTGGECITGVCTENVCSSMTRTAALVLDVVCLAGGVI